MSNFEDRRDRVLRAAFECREDLLAYAWSLLGNRAIAEDAVQEAMLVVVKKHDQFEEGTSVLAWCRAMVRIEVLRARKLHSKERSLVERLLDDAVDAAFEEFQTFSEHYEKGLRQEALARCFDELTDRGRRLLNARFRPAGRTTIPRQATAETTSVPSRRADSCDGCHCCSDRAGS